MKAQNLRGGCQCGHVRYVMDGEIHATNVCHCRDCQLQSGSAFGMSLVIEPTAFLLESGALKAFITTTDSGRQKTCAFCPECGVRIYNATSALMSIKAGTLDDTAWLRPDAHHWVRRRQPWLALPKDVPVFEET